VEQKPLLDHTQFIHFPLEEQELLPAVTVS